MGYLQKEFGFFKSQSRPMRMLLMTNMVYALVIPLIELFLGAYIICKSDDVSLVMVYQLAQGTGIPVTFLLNGFLLRRVRIARLYALGMVVSGIDMGLMMFLKNVDTAGVAMIGFIMGLSLGFFWANRLSLALKNTTNTNRNYFYGLETFFFTLASITMPLAAGFFIASTQEFGWLGGNINTAYRIITGLVIVLALIASTIASKGNFSPADTSRFIYFRFHRLWNKMLGLAALKGVAQGFVIAAPVMLIMTLVGKESSIGSIQSAGALISAVLLYILGRITRPEHRLRIFATGLSLFLLGSVVNMALFNAAGVLVFVGCMVFARPVLDLAYFPIQLGVIEYVAAKEKRNHFSYIFNHEVSLYAGRLFGCSLFIVIARKVSQEAALRYALLTVALVQFSSVFVARSIIKDREMSASISKTPPATALMNPAEL